MSSINFKEKYRKPLSNVQMELLKLYSTSLSAEDLVELKQVLADYFAKKAIAGADRIWEQEGFLEDIMEEWLNEE
jgi:hypothetical protein